MNNSKWQVVDFCIRSNELLAEEITYILGIKPTESFNKGEPFSKRNPQSKLCDETLWSFRSSLDSTEPLESQIDELLIKLENNKNNLLLLHNKTKMEFYCGYSSTSGQGALFIGNEILKRIVNIGASFSLDLYPPRSAG